MRVPAVVVGHVRLAVLAAVGVIPDHVHKGDAHLHQPAGQQAGLARAMAAIGIAQPRWFLVQVKGITDFPGGQQGHRLGIKLLVFLDRVALEQVPPGRIEQAFEVGPACHAAVAQAGAGCQARDRQLSLGHIANDQWVVSLAQQAAVLAGGRLERNQRRSVDVDRIVKEPLGKGDPLQDRTERRHIGRAGSRVGTESLVITAGEGKVGGRSVVQVLVRHRADDRDAVGDAGDARHVLGEQGPRDAGRNRPEDAPDVVRGVRLGIPHVDMALSTAGIDHQHTSRCAKSGCPAVGGRCGREGAAKQHGGGAIVQPLAAVQQGGMPGLVHDVVGPAPQASASLTGEPPWEMWTGRSPRSGTVSDGSTPSRW